MFVRFLADRDECAFVQRFENSCMLELCWNEHAHKYITCVRMMMMMMMVVVATGDGAGAGAMLQKRPGFRFQHITIQI